MTEHHCCSGCDATGHCTHGYENVRAIEKERLAEALRDGDDATFIAAVRQANKPTEAAPTSGDERLSLDSIRKAFHSALHDPCGEAWIETEIAQAVLLAAPTPEAAGPDLVERMNDPLLIEMERAAYVSGHADGVECGQETSGFGFVECEHVGRFAAPLPKEKP